jgi:hypothetical protein
MAFKCVNRPLWWFIGSGFLLVIGLFLFIVGILAKTYLYDSVVTGLYSARYIENTYETESCSTFLLGDITCPGQRFKGWSMSSKDKYNTCMRDDAPDSKALSSAAKWCKSGSGGCKKPNVCKPGSKFTYYFFNVLNADEVLRGHPAEVKEMDPVTMVKSTDRFNIDKKQWDSTGVAQWSETSSWQLLDDSQRSLLDQVIVVPNPTAFVSVPTGTNTRMSAENYMYLVGAANLYVQLQSKLDKAISSIAPLLKAIFDGDSAIETKTLIKDLYRDATPLLKLGNVFANEKNCKSLMNLIVMAGLLKGNADFFSLLMCTNAYQNNVGISAFSRVFEMIGVRVNPEDGLFFYEYEKNCRGLNEKPSYLCKLDVICPDAGNREACLKSLLSQTDVDKLFELFGKLSTDLNANRPELFKFVDQCELSGGHKIPETTCLMIIEQLQKAGHAALYSANPDSAAIAAAYGWTDKSMAATMIPYFINGTIAQVMNFENNGLPINPSSNSYQHLGMWTNTQQSDIKTNLFTRQQVSSKYKKNGLNYFKSANGLDRSCAFDYRCMDQDSFKADGKTCTPNDQCTPNYASGYDVGVIPGTFFGSDVGTEDFHGVGKKKTLFVSDLFVQASFNQVETDASWGSILVDKWDVEHVGMRTENCGASDLMDRGIDCSSPTGTINVGYNAIYSKDSTPLSAVLPLYSSFPHFKLLTPDGPRVDTYNPLDKIIIHQCSTCPSERDFKTFLWTEPHTGSHVKGSQKIQLNVRVSANPASITRLPNSPEVVLSDGSVMIDSETDVMIPIYWIDKYDSAEDYQKDTIAFVQSVPYYFNVVFWVGLWVGLFFMAVGGFLLWKGLQVRKASTTISRMELAREIDVVKVEDGDVGREGTQPIAV